MKEKSVPFPFYTFEVLGEHFFLDVATNRIYHINKELFQFLRLSETYGLGYPDTCKKYLGIETQGKPLNDLQDQVLATAKALADNGLWSNGKDIIAARRKPGKKELANFKKSAGETIDSIYLMLAETCNLKCIYCFCESNP